MMFSMFTSIPLLMAMATPTDAGGSVWVQFVPFAMILAIFYFVILLPMKRRQKKVKDFQAALKWYRKAAAQNEPQAQFNLGYMYYNGEAVLRD